MVVLDVVIFFFFQAEEGIRDYDVTGVQTCALPICKRREDELANYQREQYARVREQVKQQTGDYIWAAHRAAKVESAKVDELARKAKLDPEVTRRWMRHLAKRRESGDPVFAAWFVLAKLDAGSFDEQAKAALGGEALAKAHPGDQEVQQLSKNLTASRTLSEGGYDKVASGESDYRAVLKDEAEAVLLEQENRRSEQESTAENLIKEYEQRLVDEPENLKLIRSLAELHSRVKNFGKSVGYYERFNKTNLRSDAAVDRAIVDTKLLQFDWRIEQAGQGDAGELEVERNAFEMEQIQRLSDTYPSDLSLRYDLGVLQFEAGEITPAIQSFQRSQANPHKEIPSLMHMGKCFAKRGMNDMAAGTLQKALDRKEIMDDEKMDLHYQLGCVLDSMDRTEESIEQFKLIYERDIGYRDVADRVDAYYADRKSVV